MRNLLLICIFILGTEAYAQFNGRNFSAALNGVYTTTARIYLQPYASDEAVRNNSFPIEDIFNPAIEVRYALSESIILGAGSEYMKISQGGSDLVVFSGGAARIINVEEGFVFVPFEITAYYLLPFSTAKVKFLMGGGAGYYFGSHIRKIGDAEVNTVSRKFAYGIHVNLSMDYLIRDNISIRSEMKFRDPQFTLKSAYTKRDVVYNGTAVHLLQESFDSRINIDGVTFILGIAYHF